MYYIHIKEHDLALPPATAPSLSIYLRTRARACVRAYMPARACGIQNTYTEYLFIQKYSVKSHLSSIDFRYEY